MSTTQMVTARLAGPDDMAELHPLRTEVFVSELSVPAELETDEKDATAAHAVAFDTDGHLVGTGRLLLDASRDEGVASIGRMAVRPELRGGGIGRAVMDVLEIRAVQLGYPVVELHAMVTAEGFYHRLGYVSVGEHYQEAGIEHVTMRREFLPGLRPVRDSDGPQLEVLIRDCWSEYPDCVLDVDAEEPWLRAPAAAYVKYRGAHWVLDVDGVVIASVGMRPVPERAGLFEIKSLYVGAAARRTGFGARLVRRAERYAREQGATEIELWTDTRFLDAHRLYQRLGYAFTGVTRDLHDLSHTTEYEMLKRL